MRRKDRQASRRRRVATDSELRERILHTERLLRELLAELEWFASGTTLQREALRRHLSWPEVGYVTSLARALVEEDRFSEWLRFNRLTRRLAKAA